MFNRNMTRMTQQRIQRSRLIFENEKHHKEGEIKVVKLVEPKKEVSQSR